MRAKDYRRIARENMKGTWLRSAIVMLIVLLLCGTAYDIYSYANTGVSIYKTIQQYNHEAKEGSEPTESASAETTPSETTTTNDTTSIQDYFDLSATPMLSEIIMFVTIMLGGFISLGHSIFLLNQYDGNKASVKDLISGKGLYTSSLLANFIIYAFVTICRSMLPFLGIFIGVFLQYRYAMTMFILWEEPYLRPELAVRESAKLLKGHKWRLFCLDMSFVPWHLLGLLTLGVGNVFVAAYAAAARAAFYRDLCPAIDHSQETQYADEPDEIYE